MDTAILEGLGLSAGEVRVYLALLELGSTKVGKIIKKSGAASSAVHNAVNALISKGLISFVKKGKIKFYHAVPPRQLVDFIEDKKKKVMELLPQLELKQKLAAERQEAEIFEGIKGIIAMLNRLIEDGKKMEEYLFFATYVGEKNEEIQEFFRRFDSKRAAKGLVVKGLAPPTIKPLFDGRKVLKMRYTDFPLPSDISIFKGKVAFIAWGEMPVGYLITSPQIYAMFKKFFNNLWGVIKK